MHNPTGEGVRATSTEVKKKSIKYNNNEPKLETKIKEIGSSRRNITRKKGGNENSYSNKSKKQGGAG